MIFGAGHMTCTYRNTVRPHEEKLFPAKHVARMTASNLFFFTSFFFLYIKCAGNTEKLIKILESYPVGTCKLDRPVDRKQHYFQGWPKTQVHPDTPCQLSPCTAGPLSIHHMGLSSYTFPIPRFFVHPFSYFPRT